MTPSTRHRSGHWLAVRLSDRAPNATPSAPGWRSSSATDARRESDRRGRTRPRRRAAGSTPAQQGRPGRGPIQWPDGEASPSITVGADQFVTIDRGATNHPLAARGVTTSSGSEHVWRRSRCRTSACRRPNPCCPSRSFRRPSRRLPPLIKAHGTTRWSSSRPAPSANIASLTRFDPSFGGPC